VGGELVTPSQEPHSLSLPFEPRLCETTESGSHPWGKFLDKSLMIIHTVFFNTSLLLLSMYLVHSLLLYRIFVLSPGKFPGLLFCVTILNEMKTRSTTKKQMPAQAHRVSRYAEDTVFAFLPSVLRPPVANQLQHIWNSLPEWCGICRFD